MGWPVCGLIGATTSDTVNVIFVVPVLVNVNVGACAVGLLIVDVPVPPAGGETVQVYCRARGTLLQEGGCDVFVELTVNTEQPEVGFNVNTHVGGGITHTVSV